MGKRLHAMYGKQVPLFLVVCDGGVPFYNRLRSEMQYNYDWQPEVMFIKASSYKGTKRGDLSVEWMPGSNQAALWGRDVLIVDDMVDSGVTNQALRKICGDLGALDVQTAAMLRRYSTPEDANLTYLFTVSDDAFVFGEGMDLDGQHRSLDGIHTLT